MQKPKKLEDMSLAELAQLDSFYKDNVDNFTELRKTARVEIEKRLETAEMESENQHKVLFVDKWKITKQAKETVSLKADAIDILKKTSKNAFKYIIETTDVKLLKAAIKANDIDEKDVVKLLDSKISYALVIKEVNEKD